MIVDYSAYIDFSFFQKNLALKKIPDKIFFEKIRLIIRSMGVILHRYFYNIGTIDTVDYYNDHRQDIKSVGAILLHYFYNIGTIGTTDY